MRPRCPPDFKFTVAGVEELKLPVNGAELSALHFRLPDPKGVVFFLHGNGGNLQAWLTSTDFYRRVNYDLFMVDYRGYGKSSGVIGNGAGSRQAMRAIYDHIAAQYAGKKMVIYGRSLGTGPRLAPRERDQPDLTVLVSPYQSLAAMGEKQYPGCLVDQPLPNAQRQVAARRQNAGAHHPRGPRYLPLSHAETLAKLRAATNWW